MNSLLIILTVLSLGCCNQWWLKGESFRLTGENFASTVGREKHVVVKFYTPWCMWCERMAKDWDKLFLHYKDHSDILVSSMNCQDYEDLCSNLGVHGYP